MELHIKRHLTKENGSMSWQKILTGQKLEKKWRKLDFSVGYISWPFNLDLMLYLCSGQNDLVHQYECSVLSNDKSTVINLCRKMTVTYYYITHQDTSAGLTVMHLDYSNV